MITTLPRPPFPGGEGVAGLPPEGPYPGLRVSKFSSQLADVTTRISGRSYGAAEGDDGADRLQSSVLIRLASGFIKLTIGNQETVTLAIFVL